MGIWTPRPSFSRPVLLIASKRILQYYLIRSITRRVVRARCPHRTGLAYGKGPNTGTINRLGRLGMGRHFREGARTLPRSGIAKARKQSGCQDTDDNAADFSTLIPFTPRNTIRFRLRRRR